MYMRFHNKHDKQTMKAVQIERFSVIHLTGSWFYLGHISNGFSVSLRLFDCLIFVMLIFDIHQIIHIYPNLLELISPYHMEHEAKKGT